MTAELPSRPSPEPSESQIVSATDRVKSVADKTDPRFEAALNRRNKEARIRAKRAERDAAGDESTESASAGDAEGSDASDDEDDAESFSFHMTDRDGEETR